MPSDWSKNIFSLTYNFSAVSRIIWVFYSFPYSFYIILLHDQSHCPIACQIFSKYWTRHCPDWSLASTIGDFLDVLCLKRILSLLLQFFSSFFWFSCPFFLWKRSIVSKRQSWTSNFVLEICGVFLIRDRGSFFSTFSVMRCPGPYWENIDPWSFFCLF